MAVRIMEAKEKELRKVQNNIKSKGSNLDKIIGCLYGGAVGDALGYPIEFLTEQQIFNMYGKNGLDRYQYDEKTGKALISDDTQMTLFTATGLLVGDTRGRLRGIMAKPRDYVRYAYKDWLKTQKYDFSIPFKEEPRKMNQYSWLCDVPELYSRRAPGNTCLSALENPEDGDIEHPLNNSKGCGGIMRVAPIALNYQIEMDTLDMEGAQIAALTHGHSLGYMPAAVVTHIINRIVFGNVSGKLDLKEIVVEARNAICRLFEHDTNIDELVNKIDLALELADNSKDNLSNIHCIGEGWVAEETLGIALYCSLRYQNDFSAGVIAAVNHSGDSDSTGAVTGNILGALLGYQNIEDRWKENLELSDVIVEVATDLCHGCQMTEYGAYQDNDWMRKYIYMHWKENTGGNTSDK